MTASLNRLLAPALAKIMTYQDAADILGISRQRVHQLVGGEGRAIHFKTGPPRCPVSAHLRRRVEAVLGHLTVEQRNLLGVPSRHSDRPRGRGQTAWEAARAWILAAAWLEGASLDDLDGLLGYGSRKATAVYLHRLRAYGYPFPRRSPQGRVWLDGPLAGKPVDSRGHR